MKLTKKVIDDLQRYMKLEDQLRPILHEKLFDDTVSQITGGVWEYAVEALAPGFYDVVGNYRDPEIGFVCDKLAEALFYHGDLKTAKRCIKIYKKLKKEQR